MWSLLIPSSSWLWKGKSARSSSRHKPLPCPVVFGRGLSFTQAFECGSFSANMPQVLVLKAPHRGLRKDWSGRWEEEEQEDSLLHDSFKPIFFPCWDRLPLPSFTAPGNTDSYPSLCPESIRPLGMEFHTLDLLWSSASTVLLTKQGLSSCLTTHQPVHFLSKHLLISYFVPNDSVIWVWSLSLGTHYRLLKPCRI